jgi:aspartyl aminopeptidase
LWADWRFVIYDVVIVNFDKVTHIHFGVDFNDPIYNIPETITHIKISKDYPHEIPGTVTHVCYRSTTGKHK